MGPRSGAARAAATVAAGVASTASSAAAEYCAPLRFHRPRRCYTVATASVAGPAAAPGAHLIEQANTGGTLHGVQQPVQRQRKCQGEPEFLKYWCSSSRISSSSRSSRISSTRSAAAHSFTALLLNVHDVADAPPGRLSAAAKTAASQPRLNCVSALL